MNAGNQLQDSVIPGLNLGRRMERCWKSRVPLAKGARFVCSLWKNRQKMCQIPKLSSSRIILTFKYNKINRLDDVAPEKVMW